MIWHAQFFGESCSFVVSYFIKVFASLLYLWDCRTTAGSGCHVHNMSLCNRQPDSLARLHRRCRAPAARWRPLPASPLSPCCSLPARRWPPRPPLGRPCRPSPPTCPVRRPLHLLTCHQPLRSHVILFSSLCALCVVPIIIMWQKLG